jgi:hypothetical protein
MTLHLTGHPFIDIGLTTLVVMAGKRRLADLTEEDLLNAAGQLKQWYTRHRAVRVSYVSLFFHNSPFWQKAVTLEGREAYANEILFAFQKDRMAVNDEESCAYFPELAAVTTVFRKQVPLLNGENVRNFSASGQFGLHVSGLALLAINAMPFGCLKCKGRILAFHQQSSYANDEATEKTILFLARKNYERNQQMIALLPPDEELKYPDFGGDRQIRYITQLIAVWQNLETRNAMLDYITGYYFTNYGTGAEMEIIRLDHTVMKFIDMALLEARDAWNRAVNSNWIAGKKGELEDSDEDRIASGRRNWLYEQLFSLPDYPFGFLAGLKKAPHWKLIEIFLKEVLLMEQKRIETYKKLGDLLTAYALKFENQPHSFYYAFSRARSYTALRGVIQTAAEKMFKVGTENTLFTYDDFIAAFEHPSERYSQWRLARDLISIRMLELLHQNKIDLSELPDEEMNLKALAEEEQS